MSGISSRTRFLVFRRDGFRCVYCGGTAEAGELHVDHVTAKSKGGANSIDNYVTACSSCNLGKGALSVEPKNGVAAVGFKPVNALVGKCVLFLDEAGSPNEQAQIRRDVEPDKYLVEFHSWLTGAATESQVLSLPEILSRDGGRALFFDAPAYLDSWVTKFEKANGECGL